MKNEEGGPGFWIVLAKDDDRLKRHHSFGAAEAEARRLAEANEGRRFDVLEVKVGYEQPPTLKRFTYDDIPF